MTTDSGKQVQSGGEDGIGELQGPLGTGTRPESRAVSVTCTVLNEGAEIEALIESLMAQTLAPAQVIVVDGGSKDGTWERLEATRAKHPTLIAIRDESCNLASSTGPIARGRNVGIRAATSEVIACVDAGCTYAPDWLENLTAPIRRAEAEYAVGGSYIDPAQATVWDVASASFFGVKLNAGAPTKSCTARSMAFRKGLWERVGGFPETVFLGEDTAFDAKVREVTAPAFAVKAKANYHPRQSFRSAVAQMASYAITDGVLGGRWARLTRNLARCAAEILAVLFAVLYRTKTFSGSLGWGDSHLDVSVSGWKFAVIPLIVVLALEVYFAFRLDWKDVRRTSLKVMAARLVYSLLVPWIVAWYQTSGAVTGRNRPNRQNR
jgi:glycosyltransferase involved in cell wall biosynthesis